MDDAGNGGRRSIDRPVATALATATALVLGAAVPLQAAEEAPVSSLKGDKYRMAAAKMADQVTRYADAKGDQTRLDGTPEPDAAKWSDIKAVYVAPTKTPPKLLTKMNSDYPPGTANSFYGSRDPLGYKDRAVFVAVEMARKLPANSRGQQVEIGLSGKTATPVQNGTDRTTWAGTESFTLAGLFSNGVFAAADTDVGGRQPGLELEDGEYYDTESGTFGFYLPKKATWYLVVPRAGDTDAITVSVRSSTDVGSVIDRLEVPGGGHFVNLRDTMGGFKPKAGPSTLSCRSLETFNGESGTIESLDIDANLVRYTAGVAPGADPSELLGPAIEAAGPVRVALSRPFSEDAPEIVDGELTVTPEGNAVSLTFEAPEGQWSFALADEPELVTPAGEPIIDHMSLTGPAGVQVGPALDGFVAGDLRCLLGATDATGPVEDPPENAADAGDAEEAAA